MRHQHFQQLVLAGRDPHRLTVAAERAAPQIEFERADAHTPTRRRPRILRGAPDTAQHREDACDQFAQVAGLGDVVVGADLEPDDAVHVVALGGEHDHRHAAAQLAQAAAQADAVLVRQHQIEHDQVVAAALQAAARSRGRAGTIAVDPVTSQKLADHLSQAQIVVDQQNLGFHRVWLRIGMPRIAGAAIHRRSDHTVCVSFPIETIGYTSARSGEDLRRVAPQHRRTFFHYPGLTMRRPLPPALLTCLPLLGACEGHLTLDLAASPADDIARVEIALSTIELLGSDGGTTRIDPVDEAAFNLLAYTGDDTRRIADADGDVSGRFVGLRLRFDDEDAYVRTASGASVPLELLSAGEYADLELDLDDTDSVALVAAVDLRFSLIDRVADLGVWQLVPVTRVVKADGWGTIAGTVDADALGDGDCRDGRSVGRGVAVYVYPGLDVVPTDYHDSGSVVNLDQPVASAPVAQDSSGLWRYTINYLAPGYYTVAWTCEGDAEHPREDDDLVFQARANALVAAAATTPVDF
ncbi:uncharacterized protein DUF4382 [Sinimarinibacterium flocculans]|uniref:Uncharacterized protein DUF4382 n=3 Tax=Sinimarinibacterium flocculans TaxID=985250 RepID=A0A318EIF3_9GAMM|nr:uncharacterized protein DUF4382 [Sinimarinibacterium flocculans]